MKVKRTELLKALKAVLPGVDSKGTIDQSESFIFKDNRVFTFNNNIAVSHPIEIDLVGAISAKEFYDLTNKVKVESFEFTVDKGELRIKGSKAKAGLRMEKEINLPLEETGMPENWIELPKNFEKAIGFCVFSASRDEGLAVLTHIYIHKDVVTSCDNHRLTEYYLGKDAVKAFPKALLIPAVTVKDIISHEPTEYATTQGWVHFRNELGVLYSCRYMEGVDYPDFTNFVEVEGDAVKFPAELSEILDRSAPLCDGNRANILLEDGTVTVFTENKIGWFEEQCDAEFDGEPVEFEIQPEFLKALLKFKGDATINEKALRFDSDNFIHVVQLLAPKKK